MTDAPTNETSSQDRQPFADRNAWRDPIRRGKNKIADRSTIGVRGGKRRSSGIRLPRNASRAKNHVRYEEPPYLKTEAWHRTRRAKAQAE